MIKWTTWYSQNLTHARTVSLLRTIELKYFKISSSSSSSSQENLTDVDAEDSLSEYEENCLYGNEPEYTEEELTALGITLESDEEEMVDSDASEEDETVLSSSRLENLHWCRCTKCVIMETLPESRCCKEFHELLGEKLNSVNCVTENPRFKAVCLQSDVLETAYIQNRRYNNRNSNVSTVSNR